MRSAVANPGLLHKIPDPDAGDTLRWSRRRRRPAVSSSGRISSSVAAGIVHGVVDSSEFRRSHVDGQIEQVMLVIQCPTEYPTRRVYYLDGEDNQCSPCACSPPEGDACSSLVSIYADDACSNLVKRSRGRVLGPRVRERPRRLPLGSKQASAPTYTPGTCQPSGGEATDDAQSPLHVLLRAVIVQADATPLSLLALVLVCAACRRPTCAAAVAPCRDAGSDRPRRPGSCPGVCLPGHDQVTATSLLWMGAPSDTPPACPSVLPERRRARRHAAHRELPIVRVLAVHRRVQPARRARRRRGRVQGGRRPPFNTTQAWDRTCRRHQSLISSASSLTVIPPRRRAVPARDHRVDLDSRHRPRRLATGSSSVWPREHAEINTSSSRVLPKRTGSFTCIAIGHL